MTGMMLIQLALAALVPGWGNPAPAVNARLNVVATTADLGALAEAIGGSAVSVQVLAKPTEDAHFVDAKPVSS